MDLVEYINSVLWFLPEYARWIAMQQMLQAHLEGDTQVWMAVGNGSDAEMPFMNFGIEDAPNTWRMN